MDEPEELLRRVNQVQDLYFTYYDAFYDLAKQVENGKESSCYTVFQIWGEGKIAKLQCDFSAMISPDQFREFVQEALRGQAKQLNHSLYLSLIHI